MLGWVQIAVTAGILVKIHFVINGEMTVYKCCLTCLMSVKNPHMTITPYKIILWFCVNVLNLPLWHILCFQHENVGLNPILWIWMLRVVNILLKAEA